MPFTPPFCPNRPCFYSRSPRPGFARRHGGFLSQARGRNVPRFLCTGCGGTFSSSTFRYSYRQKKPHVDPLLMRLVCSGVSLRGAARLLGINPKTVHLKLLRLARHSRKLHRALLARGPLDGHFQLDELETFESNRFQPLSVPVLWLERALDMYAGWLNYCRGITIRTRTSPAQALGLAQRRLSIQEWLSWRQDWHAAGRLLPSPLRTTPLQPR